MPTEAILGLVSIVALVLLLDRVAVSAASQNTEGTEG
jgi:hypothetical protein